MQKEKAIAQISQTSGLLYFYEGGEPFSEQHGKSVSDFANSYHMTVIPIAMTKSFSPLFPNSRVDSGQATQMGVKHRFRSFYRRHISKNTQSASFLILKRWRRLQSTQISPSKMFG